MFDSGLEESGKLGSVGAVPSGFTSIGSLILAGSVVVVVACVTEQVNVCVAVQVALLDPVVEVSRVDDSLDPLALPVQANTLEV